MLPFDLISAPTREVDLGPSIEIAKSEEETVVRIRGDQVFQFAKGGLFHGKNPVPTR